ncbi:transcriptional regulator, XRE family [Natronoarchaeum philippinense]|uniref:Transcriptional regulator, XRE family n=1 Tax=Natronoarchaeum philippinense TaxID=558529 RepID=A0A285N515_NATPI|nr:multiprotein bridging factor aMBF1 [Natronoarchaeum philippinense]SNZ04520.1 transcriptional regulator, XRE family [Natronoarchaeum philippinense]
MVQCEMCGANVSSPKTVKVEGAELDVCDDCADFGTEVKTQSTSSSSTKYSTSSSSSSGGDSSSSSSAGGGGSTRRRSDMFDDMDEVVTDYDDRIRQAREDRNLSQSDLANELNEKASLIRKLERGDTLPDDDIQSKLESFLEISLTGGAGADDEEWSGGSSTGEYTLGDVVKRKD